MPDQTNWELQAPISRGPLERDEVLAWLEAIQNRSESPVIQECLRCVREEIVHLTSTGGEDLEQIDGQMDVIEVQHQED